MNSIGITFLLHIPQPLKTFRFADLGSDHAYFDTSHLKHKVEELAEGYVALNTLWLDFMQEFPGKVQLNLCITGATLELFEAYSPALLESFQAMAQSGQVCFLGGTYSHSIAGWATHEMFNAQVEHNTRVHQKLLGIYPTAFCNSALMYSDKIGEWINGLGFQLVLTVAEPSCLGWESANQVFKHPTCPGLTVALSNPEAHTFLARRLGDAEWKKHPITETEWLSHVEATREPDSCTQVVLPYEWLCGIFQKQKSALLTDAVQLLAGMNLCMVPLDKLAECTPQPKELSVKAAIAETGIHKDAAELLNEPLPRSAFDQLMALQARVNATSDKNIQRDFARLQALEHFVWMQSKWEGTHALMPYPGPYENAYKAFINYMNVLSDLELRVNALLPPGELSAETHLIHEAEIQEKNAEIKRYKSKLKKVKRILNDLNDELQG